ncbi:unnamed protein product [Pleuronectes platessa]|uniref:Transmembrane protein TMEM132 cohesin-like domain-containing protein n=1 Tax=Pleuronectes platessa TaxID=8262 RepID=A0A9N7VAR6_PLEPL|nr:unnamed protein product [Pleuronectes platessa]
MDEETDQNPEGNSRISAFLPLSALQPILHSADETGITGRKSHQQQQQQPQQQHSPAPPLPDSTRLGFTVFYERHTLLHSCDVARRALFGGKLHQEHILAIAPLSLQLFLLLINPSQPPQVLHWPRRRNNSPVTSFPPNHHVRVARRVRLLAGAVEDEYVIEILHCEKDDCVTDLPNTGGIKAGGVDKTDGRQEPLILSMGTRCRYASNETWRKRADLSDRRAVDIYHPKHILAAGVEREGESAPPSIGSHVTLQARWSQAGEDVPLRLCGPPKVPSEQEPEVMDGLGLRRGAVTHSARPAQAGGYQRVLQVDLEVNGLMVTQGGREVTWQVEYPLTRSLTNEVQTLIRLAPQDLGGIVPLAMVRRNWKRVCMHDCGGQ